ncbi:neutral sphingomyelinase [Brevipalpus obovatus]|uniref:neutral sphingomyelinase n=1 Tax=Brevipalpus obovatus TaxID=246614 RepID=UPI003D9EA130
MSDSNREKNLSGISLNIITLNCWGLLFFSKHRRQRIQAIASYLNEQKYDLVFLQELWVRADFELIKQTTSSCYKFAHLFSTKSILGTSGLAILSKWEPSYISFLPYSVNGSPFRPWHGDWFTGKGVAYARVEIEDLRVHLFCTHMHAQYNDKEALEDQYSIHRICQSFQLGKFINMTRDLVSDVGRSSDLFILAGDLNTSPEEFPFQLLESLTGLHNCYNHTSMHEADSGLDLSEFITCGHSDNTYSGGHFASPETNRKKKNSDNSLGKQIDFVLYKLINKRGCDRTLECHQISSSEKNIRCFAEKIKCSSKDPYTGLSFSDHQPVAVRLRISKSHFCPRMSGDSISNSLNLSLDGDNSDEVPANSFIHHNEVNSIAETSRETTNLYLDRALKLTRFYMNQNKAFKQRFTYSLIILGLFLILFMLIAFSFYNILSFITLCFSAFVVILLLVISLMIIEITFRYEQHGLSTVIEDLNCTLMKSH